MPGVEIHTDELRNLKWRKRKVGRSLHETFCFRIGPIAVTANKKVGKPTTRVHVDLKRSQHFFSVIINNAQTVPSTQNVKIVYNVVMMPMDGTEQFTPLINTSDPPLGPHAAWASPVR